MKLTTITHVSVDGVIQGLGGPDHYRRGGFQRGGWAIPLFDDEAATFLDQVFQRADAFLFGRRTCRSLPAPGEPAWGESGNNPISVALNTRPKYVASTTLTELQWADTTVLSGDVAAAIGELKAKPAGELQVHGSGALVRWLLDNHLVDEITLLTYPVVIGQGTRLFPDSGPDIALDLVESRADSKGNDPGLPAHRAPAVCNRDRRPRRRLTPAAASGDIPERSPMKASPARSSAQAVRLVSGLAVVRDPEVSGDDPLHGIVGSTQKGADVGDSAWRDLLARHRALVFELLTRYRRATASPAFSTWASPVWRPERRF